MYEIRYQDVVRLSSLQIKRYIDAVKENLEKQFSSSNMSSDLKMGRSQILNHVTSSVNVVIDANQINLEEINFKNVLEILQKGKELNLPVVFYVTGGSNFVDDKDRINLLYNEKALGKLKQLNEMLINSGASELRFIEDENYPQRSWRLKDVVEINEKIDKVVDFIKCNNMSPFEAAAYIHKVAQSRFSYQNGGFDSLNVSCIVDIVKSNETICFGFSKYCKAIADKLNNPALKYKTFMSKIAVGEQGCAFAEKFGFTALPSGHVQNLINIYDSKYGISGAYVSDACFDCKDENYTNGKGFSNFMFSVEDLLNYNSLKFSQPYTSIESIVCGNFDEKESEPNVVKFNKHISNKIDKDKLYTCLRSVYMSMYSKESIVEVDVRLKQEWENSANVSKQLFNDKSNNVFIERRKTQSQTK